MGSGHILCVLFDVLVRIYEDYGYTAREAAVKIVENNLWGLDIDERAAQLSYFAVMMKARQYDRRFFTRKVQPHVYAIEESNGITSAPMNNMGLNLSQEEYSMATKQAIRLVEEMHDAKEYGSIIHVTLCDWDVLRRFAEPREEEGQLHLDINGEIEASTRLQRLIDIGEALAQKYDIVVTNPPYMGSSGMGSKLSEYVKKNYPDSKSDLFACFLEQGFTLTKPLGYESMITMESWMFLSSFEKLRSKLMQSKTIKTLVHMPYLGKGSTSLGINFGTDMAVIQNRHFKDYMGIYDRIAYYETDNDGIPFEFPTRNEYFKQITQDNFFKIPGSPVAYWVSDQFREMFGKENLGHHYDVKAGICTGKNNSFIFFWHEVDFTLSSLCNKTAFLYTPHNKGGEFRKWYGNREYFLKYSQQALKDMAKNAGFRHDGREYYFRPHVGWSKITSGKSSFRYYEKGFTFDSAGLGLFPLHGEGYKTTLAILNSKIIEEAIALLNPTLNVTPIIVKKLPYVNSQGRIDDIVENNIILSKEDWDSFETSWDFKEHPFISSTRQSVQKGEAFTIEQAFKDWHGVAEERFHKLKENEEELNRIFIDIYGLSTELTSEIEDKDVTVRRADQQREVRSFISYAVGCMFGRYSLNAPGLVYAGGKWDDSKYLLFQPDKDAIIPICDDEYFEDDVVGRFVKFVEVVFGRETLEENLRFIADSLGGKGSSREVIRSYFINDFYTDHLKVYQKRPIYWLFDSGKKNGFKCLIYMHRYQPDTIARIRTDYVHEQQSRYRTAIADIEQRISGASTSERVKLSKQLATLQAQTEEIQVYEEKIHHLADQMIKIDLDDGVKHNYEIFKDVLAKIK